MACPTRSRPGSARAWASATIGAAVVVLLSAAPAAADKNDLVLARLSAPTTAGNDVVPDGQSFRSLVSELGVAVAPRLASPADTRGVSGFSLAADFGMTSINADRAYWCATEETDGCAAGQGKGSGHLQTLGFTLRKGLWLPFPSVELTTGVNALLGSSMWTAHAGARIALHEGHPDWPLPSVAARLQGSRLIGSSELDLTIVSFDLTISKSFGIAQTTSLAPFAGWSRLWMIPRAQVVDRTPGVDAIEDDADLNNNFVFPDQSSIKRDRFFGGLELRWHSLTLLAEIDVALAGGSTHDASLDLTCDAVTNPDDLGRCDAADKAGQQQTYLLSVAADF